MYYPINHERLPRIEPLILDRSELKKPLAKYNAAQEALAALPGRYAAAHEQWKAEAQKVQAGAPMPLEPPSYPPVEVKESAEMQLRFAADALTTVVGESRDELMDVVKEKQAEMFEEVKDMTARLNEITKRLHGLVRSALWIDEQSPVHAFGRERHLILTLEPADLVNAVAKGSTFIDNKTGRI